MDIHRYLARGEPQQRRFFSRGKLISDELIVPLTDEERARLDADYLRTHPPGVERISGCCDAP